MDDDSGILLDPEVDDSHWRLIIVRLVARFREVPGGSVQLAVVYGDDPGGRGQYLAVGGQAWCGEVNRSMSSLVGLELTCGEGSP